MDVDLFENQNLYRLIFFGAGLALFWSFGLAWRYRRVDRSDYWRWINNLSLIAVNSFLVRIVFPLGLVTLAAQNTYGLFNFLKVPLYANVILSVIFLDLIIYTQHLIFHYQPLLWRLHAVHHSDTGFDVTTALRFHPLEIGISVLVKCVAIIVLGVGPLGVLVFEILLNLSAMFNHSNFRLPKRLETALSLIIVTPDFHRIHHSVLEDETNSNFGFFLSIWDRVFKTFRHHSRNDLRSDTIGLTNFRSNKDQRLDSLLYQPFKGVKK